MDSKIVNEAIKKKIWPYLKDQGYTKFTSRNAWRYREKSIEVINFQSFNSCLAASLGCTTYSFTVNLGIYFTIIPGAGIKERDGFLLPEEYHCHFRKQLKKGLYQKEIKRKELWYIDKSGSNLDLVIDHVKKMIISDGLPWFDHYSHLDTVLKRLLNNEEDMNGTWGYGRKGSPNWNFIGGYMAYSSGDYNLAGIMLKNAMASGCFQDISERLRTDYELIREKMSHE